jgi:membrane associated rhomboid family serine protease
MFLGVRFFIEPNQLAVYYPGSPYFQPYQIVTHMFMHGNFMHLLFNMFAIYMFGPPVEAVFGPKRFLFYYLATGLGSFVLHMAVMHWELTSGAIPMSSMDIPTVGASGAVFGLLVAYGMNFPNSVIQLLFPPIPLKAKYFVLIYAALELYLGLSGKQPGVAHFGGALFGFLIITFWHKFPMRFN